MADAPAGAQAVAALHRLPSHATATPLVSVVIPTFERPDYLRVALQSVIAQTESAFEIIVQDNASKADPGSIVEALNDRRIAFYRQPRTVSQVENVVSACARARGKYLAVLGDDDVWAPRFLATLIRPLDDDASLVVAFCDHGIIDISGRSDPATAGRVSKTFGRHRLRTGAYRTFDDIALVRRSICAFSAAVFRRADIDWREIPLDLGFGPIDHFISYLAVRSGKGCYYISERLADYRYHKAALSSSPRGPDRRIENARYAMVLWRRLVEDDGLSRRRPYYAMKLGFNALIIVLNLLRQRDWNGAFAQARRFAAEGTLRPGIVITYVISAIKLQRLQA